MSQYHIEVNLDRCNSCGVCYTLDPLHFKSDIDRKSHVINEQNVDGVSRGDFDDAEIKKALETEVACPTSAITITDARM